MNDEILINEASLENAGDILEIQTQTWLTNYPNPEIGITREDVEEKTKQWHEEGEERIKQLINIPNSHTWIAKHNGKVVGFIGVLRGERSNSIEAVHILPDFQGKGIGTQLIRTALEWFGNNNPVSLEVVTYNIGAQRLYERLGFKKQDDKTHDTITLPNGKQIPKLLMVKD